MLICPCCSHLGSFLSCLLSPQEPMTGGVLFFTSSVSQANSSLFLLSMEVSLENVCLGNRFSETTSYIFPFQYAILNFESHLPKAISFLNSSFLPHSAAVLTMLLLHYFSYVLLIVLNQPFVTSAVPLQLIDFSGLIVMLNQQFG